MFPRVSIRIGLRISCDPESLFTFLTFKTTVLRLSETVLGDDKLVITFNSYKAYLLLVVKRTVNFIKLLKRLISRIVEPSEDL